MKYITFRRGVEEITCPVGEIYFSDKIPDDLEPSDRIMMQDIMRDWGDSLELDEYIWLEERYQYYVGDKALTPAAKSTIRLMCLTELEIRKAKAIGEESIKLEKQYTDYLKLTGLSDFTLGETKKPYEKTLESWIAIEEQTDPIDWVQSKYDDICGFRADNDEILRAIANKALGTRNYPELTEELIVAKPKVERKETKSKRSKKHG